ncbi:MAG: TetR family transcriptional regulator [Chloroflexota bacterium]
MLGEVVKTDPRVKRTRQLLQRALIELLQEKPFESVTVQEIAARAEVNRATFYAHFEDKNALVNAMVREMFESKLDEKLPEQPDLTIDNLRLLILTTCEYIGEFVGHCAPMRQPHEQANIFIPVQHYLYEILTNWISKADGTAQGTLAMTISWAIWGTIFEWARAGRKIPAARLTDQIMVLAQSGLHDYLRDEVLASYLKDTVNARMLKPDGTYQKVPNGSTPFDAQLYFVGTDILA